MVGFQFSVLPGLPSRSGLRSSCKPSVLVFRIRMADLSPRTGSLRDPLFPFLLHRPSLSHSTPCRRFSVCARSSSEPIGAWWYLEMALYLVLGSRRLLDC